MRALRTAAGHPGSEGPIETIETHLSWIFLTPSHAYKLKKPASTQFFDYTLPQARKRACETELRLNLRLATGVYLEVVPARRNAAGRHVDGHGEVVDWLLKMRRLQRDSMLDACIQRRAVTPHQLDALAPILSRFYAAAAKADWTGPEYRRVLGAQLASKRATLLQPRYQLDPALVHTLCAETEHWLDTHTDCLDRRAPRVLEAHGDLRPEHICLESKPVIIDCLDFARELRLLDPLSELAFLDLECRRLGNEWIGPYLTSSYLRLASDQPNDGLNTFYGRYHALVRAGLAAARLDEPGTDVQRWRARAQEYIALAAHLAV